MVILRQGIKQQALGVVGAVVGVLVVLHVLVPDGGWGEASYLSVILGAGVFAVWGVLRRPPESRAAWCWVAGGVFLSALGDLGWSIYVHVQGVEPDISVADVPWLASYVALAIGLLILLRAARRSERADVDGMIDMAVVAIVSLLVVWQVTVQATISDTSVEPGVRAIWASYPILDAVLLRAGHPGRVGATRRRPAPRRRDRQLARLGLLLHAVPDVDVVVALARRRVDDRCGTPGGRDVATERVPSAHQGREDCRSGPGGPRDRTAAGARHHRSRVATVAAPIRIRSRCWPRRVVLAVLAFLRASRLLRSATRAHAELNAAEQYFRALVQRSTDAALILEPDGTGPLRQSRRTGAVRLLARLRWSARSGGI